jgi:hypothetical protein
MRSPFSSGPLTPCNATRQGICHVIKRQCFHTFFVGKLRTKTRQGKALGLVLASDWATSSVLRISTLRASPSIWSKRPNRGTILAISMHRFGAAPADWRLPHHPCSFHSGQDSRGSHTCKNRQVHAENRQVDAKSHDLGNHYVRSIGSAFPSSKPIE